MIRTLVMRTLTRTVLLVVLVSSFGCAVWKKSAPVPTKERIVLHGVVDFNRAAVRPDSVPLLEYAALKLRERENARIVVTGHSDSTGPEDYNQKLSLRRAESIRDRLVDLGVLGDRIQVTGKGSSEPIASNATREGRAQNRRVELIVYEE